jgi:hypothetical protein
MSVPTKTLDPHRMTASSCSAFAFVAPFRASVTLTLFTNALADGPEHEAGRKGQHRNSQHATEAVTIPMT